MNDIVKFSSNVGTCSIDFENKRILFTRKGIMATMMQLPSLTIPFSDITDIEYCTRSDGKSAEFCVIVNGYRFINDVNVNITMQTIQKEDISKVVFVLNRIVRECKLTVIKEYGRDSVPKVLYEGTLEIKNTQVNNNSDKPICDVCGKTGTSFSYNSQVTGKTLYRLCYDCNNKYKSSVLGRNITIGESKIPFNIYPQTIEEVKNSISGKSIYRPKEHRMRCNACGNLFCYSDVDLWNNLVYKNQAKQANSNAFFGALAGSLISSDLDSAARDRYRDKIVDYTKCPKCNSKDIIEVTNNNNVTTNTLNAFISPADEIKKYKELLDMGAITQEEFDAKKKQLLGL